MNIHEQCRLLMIDGHEILHGKIGDDSMNTHEAESQCCMDDEVNIAVGDLIGGDPRHADFIRLECLKIASNDMRHIQSLGMEEDYLADETAGEFIRDRAAMHAAFVLGEDEDSDAVGGLMVDIEELRRRNSTQAETICEQRERIAKLEAGHKAVTGALYCEPVMRLKSAAIEYRRNNAGPRASGELHGAAVAYALWAETPRPKAPDHGPSIAEIQQKQMADTKGPAAYHCGAKVDPSYGNLRGAGQRLGN